MKYEDAAAIIMNYIVAYILLFELGNLTAGKSVLFHSAGGGVVSTDLYLIYLLVSHFRFRSFEKLRP